MEYSFLPNPTTTENLQKRFKQQLLTSYVEMLEQVVDYAPASFDTALISRFANIPAASLNGFHCFVYHQAISLAEANDFTEAARLLNVISSESYRELPRFVPSSHVDERLLSEILLQIKKGTTHTQIELRPVAEEVEKAAAETMVYGLQKLKVAYPELAADVDLQVRSILFFDSAGETKERALSFTGDKLQSLILINATIEPTWIFLLDKLVHEAAHCYLYSINLHEELVLNEEGAKYSSPLRRDARDMNGIYHATFVIQRLILAFTHILQKCQLTPSEQREVEALLDLYHSRLGVGFDMVMKNGVISNLARDLLTAGQECSTELRHP